MNTLLIVIISFVGGAAVTSIIFQAVMRKRERSFAELSGKNMGLEAENKNLTQQLAETKKDAAERLAACKEEAEAQIAKSEERAASQLKEQMEALKLTFKESASKIFDEKSKSLSESNEKGIKTILDPLKEKMEAFTKEVIDTKEKSIKNSASLEEQIKSMMEKASSLGAEANNLATALKGNNKIQGNWGETRLEKLLQDAGFVKDRDYFSQETVRESSGQAIRNDDTSSKLVPDIILHFPDKKAVIIDSKTSLTAYLDYCKEGITQEESDNALKRHIESIRTHIKELSRKDYAAGVKKSGMDSLKYCIMYIPNEMAFQLFFKDNQAEWLKAFDENGVIVVGDLYLITMLKIIRLTWDAQTRQKNTEKIIEAAGELLDRVGLFVKTFEGIGTGISTMEKNYEEAKRKLYSRISIATTSRKLNNLGIKSKYIIDEGNHLVEDAESHPMISEGESSSEDN